MKNLIRKYACPVMLGVALALTGGTAYAQVTTNLFTFDTTISGSWGSWQSGYSGFWDSSVDHTGNGGGSLYWYQDVSFGNGAQIFNTWGAPGSNPYYPGNPPAYIDLSSATNISFWVKWDTAYSTLGINDFNTQDYTSPAGNGDKGIAVGIQGTTAGGQGTVVGTAYIPNSASNGWVLVNVPITAGGVPNENQSPGMSLFKWNGTTASGTGVFAFWIDDIQAQYPGVLPPEILKSPAPASAQGLNIYDDGNAGDRQSIETVVTSANGLNYGWVGNGAPVTYSVHIAQGTPANYLGGQVHIMILPGTGITELAPDYNEANALVLFIQRQTNGVIAQLRYKLNDANDNKNLFGTDTNVFGGGGSAVTNTIVAGYGGLLGSVTNVGGYVGTWSIQMTSNTGITLTSPDGSHTSFAFPQASDAQAFSGPVTVYWGVQPNSPNWFQDTVLSSVSISGSPNTLNEDLTQALDPSVMALCASTPSLLFATPANAVYWLQWAPPNPNFALQGASSVTGPWANVVGPAFTTTNFLNSFATSNFIASARNYNPPLMAIAYDFGDDSAPTIDWLSGPTYDAGGSAGSGSVELKWAWAGGNGNEAFTMDLFPSGQNLANGTLSFDIMLDPSSTAGTNSDYGYLNVIARDGNYGWNPTSLGEGLLTAAGGTVGTWAHVSIPLGGGADSVIRGLTFQISNDGGINGSQTIYVDNLQLTTSNGTAPVLHNINAQNSTFITSPMLPSSGAGYFRLAK
jgi:hypothetical protein